MPFSYFDKNAAGSILTRVTNDVESLSELYSGVIVDMFRNVLMLIGIIIIMLALNVQLAFVSFSIIPIILAITIWYNKKANENFRWVRSLKGRINAYFAENISGMKMVQIFTREKAKYGEFKGLNDEYNEASRFMVFLNAVFRPVNELINSLAITLLVWFCARPILEGGLIEIGILYAFIDYSRRFFAPINDLADRYTNVLAGKVAAERIFDLLDNNEGYEETEPGIKDIEIKGKIEFKNVWFAYVKGEWVLKDVSFTVNPGETMAFVGATGSGKTTIISLLNRFYEPDKGEILIDGINITDYSLGRLRKSIGVVMQDVFLFADDVKYNIRLNEESIDDRQVQEAARYVNAHDFISKLGLGYNHEVKERGVTFSSGERQLLSFARAIAFKPRIMVLDEATANIDTQNEMIIQDSLEKISKNRTTLVIAHRLSTIRNADGIIVLHNGKIRERGAHEDLIAMDGIYKKLYELTG
jgi:ABC-type multidrug transport system fused ATPase/permease subunit